MTERNEKYWTAELTRSDNAQDEAFFDKTAEDSIKTYEGESSDNDTARKLNIWWMVIQSVLPAYYARNPKSEVKLRKKSGDDLAVLGARTVERSVQYSFDEMFDFPTVAMNSILDYMRVGRGVLWPKYLPHIEAQEVEFAVQRGASGLVNADGTPYEGEEDDLEEGEGGILIGKRVAEQVGEQAAILERVHWRDYREQAARQQSECEWKGRRAYMTQDEVSETFGKEFVKRLAFNSFPKDLERDSKSAGLYQGRAEMWELYCEASGKVYWYSGGSEKAVVEASEPPIKYHGFYPCSVLVQNLRANSTVPLADFALIRDQVLEVERLTSRIHAITQAIRVNIAAEKTVAGDIEKLFVGDLKVFPVQLPGYKDFGSIANSIYMLPIDQLVTSLNTLVQAREMALAKVYEQTGASEIVRANSDPNKTLGAVDLENSRANWRFSYRQQQVERWFGDAASKLGEIICTQFTPDNLWNIADGASLTQGNAQVWPMVCQFLKADPARKYRISIATDSMGAVDDAAEHKDRTDLLSSCGSFLQQMASFVEQHPSAAQIAIELMRYTVRTYKAGKDLEVPFDNALKAIVAEVQKKQNQPVPGAQDGQIKLQIAQMQMQSDQQKAATDVQLKQAEMQQSMMESQVKMSIESDKMAAELEMLKLEQIKLQADIAIKQQELQLKAAELQATSAQKIQETALDAKLAEINAAIEVEKANVERERVQLETYEKLIEEKRLRLEQMTAGLEARSKEPAAPAQQTPAAPPVMHFNIDARPSGNRMITRTDEAGKTVTYKTSEEA